MDREAVGIHTVILSKAVLNGVITGIRYKAVQIVGRIGIVWFQPQTIRYLEIPSPTLMLMYVPTSTQYSSLLP